MNDASFAPERGKGQSLNEVNPESLLSDFRGSFHFEIPSLIYCMG
ncbi:hypothetical protein HMPREF2534_01301 [Bacteroides thetaiotaomicron]|nr:hypothetical protein HMPREF2534_01301 [Bacteroides thetaiotaomicron]